MKRHVDPTWPAARKAALQRDDGLCVIRTDGCETWACHVHHINQRRGPNPHALEMLASVCRPCHERAHSHPEWARAHGWLLRSVPIDRVLFTRRSDG